MSSPGITGRATRSEIPSFAIPPIGAAADATGHPAIGATETVATVATGEIGAAVAAAATEDVGEARIAAAGDAIDARGRRKRGP